MNTGSVVNFLGWAFLTFAWLQVNHLFFDTIADAINEHNEQIRLKTVDNCFKLIAKDIEVCEDESDDESENENEDKLFQKSYIYTHKCLTTSS